MCQAHGDATAFKGKKAPLILQLLSRDTNFVISGDMFKGKVLTATSLYIWMKCVPASSSFKNLSENCAFGTTSKVISRNTKDQIWSRMTWEISIRGFFLFRLQNRKSFELSSRRVRSGEHRWKSGTAIEGGGEKGRKTRAEQDEKRSELFQPPVQKE